MVSFAIDLTGYTVGVLDCGIVGAGPGGADEA